MKVLRWFGLLVAAAALSFFLWVLAIDVGVVHEVSHPATVKKILNDSGLYKTAVSTLLDQKKDDGTPNTININGQEVAVNNPVLVSAANQTFPPEFIQQNVEQVIDSFNSWLNGQTTTPEFKIDLTTAKADFAKNVATGLQTKLASLPTCTDGTTVTTFNPFTATCVPKGTTPAQAATAVQTSLASSQDFLKDPVYTAASLKDDKGQPVFQSDKVHNGRDDYNHVKSSPIVIGLMALLSAIAVFFLSKTRRRGLRRVGYILVLVSVFVLGLTALLNTGLNNAKATDPDLSKRALQESGLNAARSFSNDLKSVYYPLGGVYLGLGVAFLVGSFFIKKPGADVTKVHDEAVTHKPTILDDDDAQPMPDEEIESEPKPKPEPKAAPKPKAKPKPAVKPKAPPKPKVTKISVS